MDESSVLVVDDEPGIALLCKRVLGKAGYNVAALTDPTGAVDYLKQNPIDLLLVDIRMPEVDGFKVITHARRLQPDIAVLVMTGYGTVETAIHALRQGVDGLILKPFDQGDELVASVRQALADSQQKRDAARIQALRPLFAVTESLLSETNHDRLLELIVNAVCGHLHCSIAGYYQYLAENREFVLSAGRGKEPPILESGLIAQVDSSGAPLLLNIKGPGDSSLQAQLQGLGLGAAMFVPIVRPSFRSVLFAGRRAGEAAFREADLEMFQVLARQAAVAMENARLYEEQRNYVRQVEDSRNALLQAEKMAAAGRMSASIAHEVNNPLQAVQNCLHLAGREDLPAEKRKEYFDLAKVELERLMLTVQRMLDFYRPGAVSPEKVNLARMLEHVVNLLSKQLAERGIRVRLEIPRGLSSVMAVSNQVQQVFINLTLNSFDAMPEGGDLHVAARNVKGGVEILFEDSGAGIPLERQSKIFEPFYSTKEGGTGLGLTVSYNIVTAHGGSLELLPEHGRGARFRVFLPSGGKQ